MQTGVVTGDFEDGLIWGYGPTERGRLWDDSGFTVRNAGGGNPATTVDNTPLWDYLTTPGTCPHSGLVIDETTEMITCLNSWAVADGQIFDDTIRDAPRFGLAPRLWTVFGPGQWYFIEELPPVYLDTTYFGCNANGCDIVHVPDVSSIGACPTISTSTGTEPPDETCGIAGTHNKNLSAVTAYIMDPAMFSADALAGAEGPLTNLSLTR